MYKKEACIIASGILGDEVYLFKNRDRTYKPTIEVIHEIKDDVEIVYILDQDTNWSEGMNEFGIGIVNSALAVGFDEKEKKIVKVRGQKSKDGARILKALTFSNIEDCINSLTSFQGGVKGHTLVRDSKECYSIESTTKHKHHVKKLNESKHHVRTNHGFYYSDAGYTQGEDYLSSVARRNKMMRLLRTLEKPEEIPLNSLAKIKKRTDPKNMVRDTSKMITSSQMVLNLSKKTLSLFLLKDKCDFVGISTKLPKDYKPKLKIDIYKDFSIKSKLASVLDKVENLLLNRS